MVSMSVSEPLRPVGSLNICGGITTWTTNNPSFCVYEVDFDTLLPV